MVVSPGFVESTMQFDSFVEDCSHFFLHCETFLMFISVPSGKILIQRFHYRILLMTHSLALPFLLSNLDDDNKIFYPGGQGWIGYEGTQVPMFVHELGLIKPRQT